MSTDDVFHIQKGPTIETDNYILAIEAACLHTPQVCTGLRLCNNNEEKYWPKHASLRDTDFDIFRG